MALRDLTPREREVVYRCLKAIVEEDFVPDCDFVAWVTKDDIREVISRWPNVDDLTEFKVARAINDTLNNLVHYPHNMDDLLFQCTGATRHEINYIFEKWRDRRVSKVLIRSTTELFEGGSRIIQMAFSVEHNATIIYIDYVYLGKYRRRYEILFRGQGVLQEGEREQAVDFGERSAQCTLLSLLGREVELFDTSSRRNYARLRLRDGTVLETTFDNVEYTRDSQCR